jgi:hypothetical protein
MLFHYGFYSNKQPSVPACSQAHLVEVGAHHLSKVKFPDAVVAQSKLSIPELVLRSLRLGSAAARANFVPALFVQALMIGLVAAYFYLPAAKPVFGVLTNWNVNGGLLFSFVAMGITVGGLTEISGVYLHNKGRWKGEDLGNMAFNFFVFGLLGSDEQPVLSAASALVRHRQITRNPSHKNIRRPIPLYPLSEQSGSNTGFSLEERTIFLSTDGRKDAALPAILCPNSAPCFSI